MSIRVEISLGEFLDKLAIAEIKTQRIRDPARAANVRRELESLRSTWNGGAAYADTDVTAEFRDLRAVNERLWDIEDQIRLKEARGEFDEEFIELARAVYANNDERAALKRRISEKLGSALLEEKSYPAYERR